MANIFRTKDSISTDNNDAIDVIILKKCHFSVLSKRWISDILNGHVKSVINNPSIQDLNMLAIFIDNIEHLPASTFVDFIGMSESQMSLIEFVFDEGVELPEDVFSRKSGKLRQILNHVKTHNYHLPLLRRPL
jgi:hypothetical protein